MEESNKDNKNLINLESDNKDNKNSKNEKIEFKKVKRLIIILFLLLFLFVSLVGFGIYTVIKNNNQQTESLDDMAPDLDAMLGILPGMTPQEIQDRLNAVVEEGLMNVSINPDPVFENGKARGNVRIENIAANHYDFVISIMLDETEEEIYKSGVLSPGYYIETIKLNKNLPKGDYEATARFNAYIPGTKQNIGAVAVKITIHILN